MDNNKEEVLHTKDKWSYFKCDNRKNTTFVIQCEEKIVAETPFDIKPWGYMLNTKENEANAAFIVKACNSHYEILEALKELVASYSVCVKKADQSEYIINAKEAIKKAESK